MKILVLEDSPLLLAGLSQYIPAAALEFAADFDDLKVKLMTEEVDCVILDMLSEGNTEKQPVETVKRVSKRVGLILTSTEDVLVTKIEALIAGADDYLIKPYDISELAGRIISLSRRVNLSKEEDLVFNEIRIDLNAKMVYINKKEMGLTKKELDMLRYFIGHKNAVVPKESLKSALFAQTSDFREATDLIYAHVKNLKKKLRNGGCENYLKSIYGIGYKWESQ